MLIAAASAFTDGNVGTLVRHRGLALPYFVWLSGVGACELSPLAIAAAVPPDPVGDEVRVTLIDERGRIGGRVNVVDAAAAVVVLLLIPLALGAYLLFRTPTPTLTKVVPAALLEGPDQRLEIDGKNFRPFMRVSFDTIPAKSFLLGSTKYALVDVPDLKPGAYDVVLYDYMREVARLPKALTVAPIADRRRARGHRRVQSAARALRWRS